MDENKKETVKIANVPNISDTFFSDLPVTENDQEVSENDEFLDASSEDATEDGIEEICLVRKNKVVVKNFNYISTKGALLKDFDRLCQDFGIEYFAFGNFLRGVVHYQDFLPGKAKNAIDIGLVRSEFDRLIPVLEEHAKEYNIILNHKKEGHNRLVVMIGRNIRVDTDEIYINKTTYIFISPFDKVPKPRDYMYGQFNKMKKLNTNYKIMIKLAKVNTFGKKLIRFRYKLTHGTDRLYKKLVKTASRFNDVKEFDTYCRVQSSRGERIKENQIYPIRRVPFQDFEVSIPNDPTPWTVVMDDKLRFQVESIQKADLEILAEFDRVCKKLGIGYFVCGGTMLGYVRGGGFIPWDDDIDVGLLRADYDRFITEAGKELSDKFFLQTRESDPEIPYLFSKIRMNNTEYITEYNEKRNFHKGICLDLFPFDYIPNDPADQKKFKEEVLAKAKIHNRICNMCIPEPEDGKVLNFEDFWQRLLHKGNRFRYRMKSLKKSQRNYIKVATRYNSRAKELGLTTVASFVPGYTFIKLEDLLPYQDIIFEGVPAKIPNKAEVFLEMQYKNFMELPGLHQQVGHPLIRWSCDLEKGFYENPNMRR